MIQRANLRNDNFSQEELYMVTMSALNFNLYIKR